LWLAVKVVNYKNEKLVVSRRGCL